MKIRLLVVGKTEAAYLQEGIQVYETRIKRYVPFEISVIPDVKKRTGMSEPEQKRKEGEAILKFVGSGDALYLLDEKGKTYDSRGFSSFLQQQMNQSVKQLILVIGGPYGFSDAVYQRARGKVALSAMTFSHQMVRLFAVEQIYRGLSILRGEPYHHD